MMLRSDIFAEGTSIRTKISRHKNKMNMRKRKRIETTSGKMENHREDATRNRPKGILRTDLSLTLLMKCIL
ncbi:MAG: hypothetical protein B6241_10500 [Spirochaetaceae bacterium 4572_59]|nr:MAG: hypothetical protein B6241_10500 [Spirochaetaceae bacterium 4572_59]